jgi:hypothetical protein
VKEYVIHEDKTFKVYRISKKLRKGRVVVQKIWNLIVEKKRFSLQHIKYYEGEFHKSDQINFVVGKKIVPKNGKRSSYRIMNKLDEMSKFVQRKINRILNKEFGLKFKIGRAVALNIAEHNSPAYMGLWEKPDYSMLGVIGKSLKRSIRNHCGFAGRAFIRELLKFPEHQVKEKLNTLRALKGHLTFGEVSADIKWNSCINHADFQERLKENPQILKKAILGKVDSYIVNDTFGLLSEFERERLDHGWATATDITKLHDSLSAELVKKRNANVEFPQWGLNGHTIGEYTIREPKDYHQLLDWAKYMGNCIAGYKSSILDHHVIMCGLFSGEELIYNLSIRVIDPIGIAEWPPVLESEIRFAFDQLNSRFNRGAPIKLQDKTKDFIKKLKYESEQLILRNAFSPEMPECST